LRTPNGIQENLAGAPERTALLCILQGPMILKIFSPKNSAKKFAFLTQNKAKLCKILIITLVFEKNANFFAENCLKSQKIVIITSTPGAPKRTQPIYRVFFL
jgi:hypothetical protein